MSGSIVAEVVEIQPAEPPIPAEPCHLSLGVLTGFLTDAGKGLLEPHVGLDMRDQFIVTKGAEARCVDLLFAAE